MRIDRFFGPYRFLSNFYVSPIVIDNFTYPTVEHFFQASKAADATDHHNIRRAVAAATAKSLGRVVRLRVDWEAVKVDIMSAGVAAKFAPGTSLAELLVATRDAELVEGNSWHDNYWGDCFCPRCASFEGQNTLGKSLMAQRGRLIEGLTSHPLPNA